jgi:hypothetical protein
MQAKYRQPKSIGLNRRRSLSYEFRRRVFVIRRINKAIKIIKSLTKKKQIKNVKLKRNF